MKYWTIVAISADRDTCESVGIFYCTEDRIKEIRLWYFTNPQHNDGFAFFEYRQHEVLS